MASSVFWALVALVVVGLLLRPWGAPRWAVALGGGLLAVLLPPAAPRRELAFLAPVPGILAVLACLSATALILSDLGLFRWLAAGVRPRRPVPVRLLLAGVFAAGAAGALLFTNDGAVLVLTPAVAALAVRLRLPRATAFALLSAVSFAADFGSPMLPSGNPVNLTATALLPLRGPAYAAWLFPPALAALAAAYAVLAAGIAGRVEPPPPAPSAGVPRLAVGLVLLTGAVLAASTVLSRPLALPVVASSAVALACGACSDPGLPRRVLRRMPWAPLALALGLWLLAGAAAVRLAPVWSGWLIAWARASGTAGLGLAGAVGAAALGGLVNNLPATLMLASAARAAVPPHAFPALIAGLIVGGDIGVRWSPLGSLSLLLWQHLLRDGFGDAGPQAPARTLPVTVAALAAACLALGCAVWLGPS